MFDLIIKGGTVIDGTGKRKFKSDLGIKKDKIKVLDDLKKTKAKTILNAKDCYIAPGFIDILNHTDGYLTLFSLPTCDSLIRQGVTTFIGGNCGSSLAPLISKLTRRKVFAPSSLFGPEIIPLPGRAGSLIKSVRKWADVFGINLNWLTVKEFLKEIKKLKISCNFGTLVGHSTIRRIFVGDKERDLTEEEIKKFQEMIEEAISDGALGLSFGLAYAHAKFIKKAEILRLSQVLKDESSLCAIHLRDEGERIEDSLQEVLDVAKENKLNLEISHFKISGQKFWLKINSLLKKIEESRRKGIKINFDIYPYKSTWSVLYSYLPGWIFKGSREDLIKRLSNKKLKERVIKEMKEQKIDYSKLTVATSPFNFALVGKKISEIAKEKKILCEEAVCNVLLGGMGHIICFDESLSEENIKRELSHQFSFIASDGAAFSLDFIKQGQLVHPRCFGTFPRFLGKYVRDEKLLSWEKAIQKITSLPAEKIGLKDRGKIAKGKKADFCIFDPREIEDRATFDNPFQYPRGIKWVIVNGQIVVNEKGHTGIRPGEVLKR